MRETLINDMILKTKLIEHIGNSDKPLELFLGFTYTKLFFAFILPLICLIFFMFILKNRYNNKKRKDEIILTGFYKVKD